MAVVVLMTGAVQIAVLAWALAEGTRGTATVVETARQRSNDPDLDVNCTRGMTCVLLELEGDDGEPTRAWAGRGVPQGLLPAGYERGERVDVVVAPCRACFLQLGNPSYVKVLSFDGAWASPLWCLLLGAGLGAISLLLGRGPSKGRIASGP